MKLKKKAFLLCVVAIVAVLFAIPATRDEMSWYWAQTQGDEAGYQTYLDNWPKGRHVAEARLKADERDWANNKRVWISQAIKRDRAAGTNSDVRQERKIRLEQFLWKQVTNENSTVSYKEYLARYPQGEYASEARHHLQGLGNTPMPETTP